jgi:hypothetical protein
VPEIVWPITGSESSVDKSGKSMKAMELARFRSFCCCNIAFTPITLPNLSPESNSPPIAFSKIVAASGFLS